MAQKKTAQQRGMKRAEKVLARSQKIEKVKKVRAIQKLDHEHVHGENCNHEEHKN